MKKKLPVFSIGLLMLYFVSEGQTNNYFGNSGTLNGNVWSTIPGGPYTAALNTSGGAIINFINPATVTGATITVAGINANATVSAWTAGGTMSTGGTVIPVMVGAAAVLNINEAISTAAGTGLNKTGPGILLLGTGSAYTGGFTLSAGTIIVGSINALGYNTLYLNGGTICSDANQNLTARYPGGITIGGDIQFGETTLPASGTANLVFDNSMSLGAANRVLTLGNAGTFTFGGVISNTAAAGITFTANANGTGIFDIANVANTFSGPVNIDGGEVRFAGDASFGNTANDILIDGGRLRTDATFTITHPVKLGTTAGNSINVSLGNLTIAGVITDKSIFGILRKTGAGMLTLTGANTYTGTTNVAPAGGTLQFNRPGGNTLPATNNVIVNGGTLQISSNQALNDITLTAGNITIDNGVTLTINGTLDSYSPASIILNGTGKIRYGPAGILKYSGTVNKVISAVEWPAVNAPNTVIIDNTGGVTLPITGTVSGTLLLNAGAFTIGGGGLLDMNGASLVLAGGTLMGNANADITVRGNTGGIITLPATISLRNVTVTDTRTLALNGTSDLKLYGTLSVASNAVFDNGGESQLINGGGGAIVVSGTFINRDKDNFTGTNGAIPGVLVTLNAGSNVEYGLTGNQEITKRDDYSHLIFSGGGVKRLVNACSPSGTVFITGNTTVDAGIHVFGNLNTNLSMDGGRLILRGTSNPQPHMAGTYSLTGGTVQFDCNSTSGQTIRSQTYKNIEITGLYTGNSLGNITLDIDGTFTIKAGATFEMNDNAIIGSVGNQTIVVESGATFRCGNALGFNGPVTGLNSPAIRDNIENIVLQPNSTINYSRSNPPQVSGDQLITNTMPYQHLVLSGTAGVKKAPAGILNIQGNLVKTGTVSFDHNNGTVLLNGTNQLLAGLPYNNLLLNNDGIKNLTGNASIADSLQLSNLQTAPATELSLGENFITLLSTAVKTARLGCIPDLPGVKINYGVSGRFVVERYFPPKRSWRLITAPVTAAASTGNIHWAWQHSGSATTGSETFITGKNANPLINGLDISPYNNSSLKTFNTTTQLFEEVTNTKTSLIAGTTGSADNIGFFIFVRGDRSTNNLFNPPFANSTVLRDTGKLLIKNQVFTLSGPATPGFCLVGNPYASPVNIAFIVAATPGIDNGTFYTWDPNLNAQHGAYITMTYSAIAGGKWIAVPPSPVGKQDSIIQSGQAFFVMRTLPVANMVFTELDKWLAGNQAVFRPMGNNVAEGFSLRTNLYLVNNDSTTTLADGVMAEFKDGYDNRVNAADAAKLHNQKESLALIRDSQPIAVERRAAIGTADTLFLALSNHSARNYQFEIMPEPANTLLEATLEDRYTQHSTPLNLQESSRISFAVNKEPVSADANRFFIVLKRKVLPKAAMFIAIAAIKKGNGIGINWTVLNDINTDHYVIERSADGITFTELAQLAAKQEAGNVEYEFTDENPLSGNNFYRIRSSSSTIESYSTIVSANWKANNIVVYPNPVKDGIIQLHLYNQSMGRYTIRRLNTEGKMMNEWQLNYNGEGTVTLNIATKKTVTPTVSLLQIFKQKKLLKSLKITIE